MNYIFLINALIIQVVSVIFAGIGLKILITYENSSELWYIFPNGKPANDNLDFLYFYLSYVVALAGLIPLDTRIMLELTWVFYSLLVE